MEKHPQHKFFEAMAAKAVEGWVAEHNITLTVQDGSGNEKPGAHLLRELKARLASDFERLYERSAMLAMEIAEFNEKLEKPSQSAQVVS